MKDVIWFFDCAALTITAILVFMLVSILSPIWVPVWVVYRWFSGAWR